MTNTDILNTFKASIAEAGTDALVELARENDGRTLNATQRQMDALVADEIIRRHPEVAAALDAWEADLDTEATFREVLIGAVPRCR